MMKTVTQAWRRSAAIASVTLLLGFGATADVAAQSKEGLVWWPSEWGADDQQGAANRLTPAKVLEAAAEIKTGKVYDLGRVFEESMPLFALTPFHRKYTLIIPGGPTYGPMGGNKLIWNEDYISGHLGQDGTQFDALAHMGTVTGDPTDTNSIIYYNGNKHSEIADGHGFKKLGVEQAPPIFTRGVLLDFAGLKGRMLERSEEITLDDVKAALKRQGLSEDDIRPGDALFYNTGWGTLWKTDNDKFNSGTPGLTPEAGDWVVERKVVMVGVDCWAVEAIPSPRDGGMFAPNHQKFLVENGIYIMENMNFTPLIEDEAWVFAFSFGPIPLKGATGSPARPFAIK